MNVIDLVQSLEMGRKSCLLTMTNGDDKCEIYFSQGQAKHAAYGPITGDEAVFKVLRWTEGNFQIDFNEEHLAGNDDAEYAGPADGRIAAAG